MGAGNIQFDVYTERECFYKRDYRMQLALLVHLTSLLSMTT